MLTCLHISGERTASTDILETFFTLRGFSSKGSAAMSISWGAKNLKFHQVWRLTAKYQMPSFLVGKENSK